MVLAAVRRASQLVAAAGRGDQSLRLAREGYAWAPQLRRRHGGVARTTFAGSPALVVGGPDGAELFYDTSRFRRAGAMPDVVRLPLFGDGSVHALDDAAHAVRKAMFLGLLTPESVAEVVACVGKRWEAAVLRWPTCDEVELRDEAVRALGGGVLEWSGVRTAPGELDARARDLAAVVGGFGSAGRRHWRSRRARRRTQRWCADAVRQARADPDAFSGSAVGRIAAHREDGALLPLDVAAVELHNVVRPTVAVSWLVTFAGLALHQHRHWRDELRAEAASGGDRLLEAFAHEVRRAFPFVPVLVARARHDVSFHGHHLPADGLLVLDVHGTHLDPRVYDRPGSFDPGRFVGVEPGPWTFLAQGGGDARTGHRCPGERLTIELLKDAVRRLVSLDYEVAVQDLSYPLRPMPTAPRSGVLLSSVQRPPR